MWTTKVDRLFCEDVERTACSQCWKKTCEILLFPLIDCKLWHSWALWTALWPCKSKYYFKSLSVTAFPSSTEVHILLLNQPTETNYFKSFHSDTLKWPNKTFTKKKNRISLCRILRNKLYHAKFFQSGFLWILTPKEFAHGFQSNSDKCYRHNLVSEWED